jgi:hypothetical protein
MDSKVTPSEVSKMFHEPIERVIFEKLKEDSIVDLNSIIVPSCTLFSFISNEPLDFNITEDDKESVITLIHWIGAFIGTCYFP